VQSPNGAVMQSAGPLDTRQLRRIHDATLTVLGRVGLRIDCAELRAAAAAAGASVNDGSRVVQFPPVLVEQTIEYLRKEIASGRRQYALNGVTNPRWTPPLGCKFGGACIEYLDPITEEVRTPTEQDLIRLLQLGEALGTVGFVGNPVACLQDASGRRVPGPLQRIKTAALVAKYTTKCGSTEVWNEQDLEFLLEIGQIVRGSREAYQAEPCFITAKETIAPLQFPEDDGRVLLMLAQRNLPCTIIPMPLSGGTCPCSPGSNVVMANAEILGAMTVLHAAAPEAMLAGGVISGIMDMKFGAASFSAPETLFQDAALAQLYDRLYGQDLAIGTGYIDAKYPGVQSLAEKAIKMQAAAQQGRFNFPVGLLVGGKRFSPVQAVMELEVAQCIKRLYTRFEVNAESLALDVIEEVGIGGPFIAHEHTYRNFREQLWSPNLFDRTVSGDMAVGRSNDMLERARQQIAAIWNRDDLYRIDDQRAKAIDEVVARAEQLLLH
jgi:trimethylamine---corrinoid protein Co-methyltransferase